MTKQASVLTVIAVLLAVSPSAGADEADVLDVKATHNGNNVWSFSVTAKHADTGWDHYANRFDIVAPDGTVLGVRTLLHPHVHEQPFTRSLGGVTIGENIKKVIVRANDSVHELGGKEVEVELPR